MKYKTVAYGLGKIYNRYENEILKRYNIVAHCDKNLEKVKTFSDGITQEYLTEHIDEYDKVLITSEETVSIIDDLVRELHVPIDKISVFIYDNLSYRISEYDFYGQNLEDAALMLLLNKLGISCENIKYLEIGTNDPVRLNNTFNLYQNGARGILVDPLDSVALLANIVRAEDKVITAAVTGFSAEKEISFYQCQEIPFISSLRKDFSKNYGTVTINERKVPLLEINSLLKNIEFVPDMLLIDAEGEDDKIIRAIDYEKYRPSIIVIEYCYPRIIDLIEFMKVNGYKCWATIKDINVIFVENKCLR